MLGLIFKEYIYPFTSYPRILTKIQFDMRGMTDQFPPASLQSKEVCTSRTLPHTSGNRTPTDNWISQTQKKTNGLERSGLPIEVGRVAGFLASGFSSYITGANIVVDGGAR
jgi:NAD(P)-dependent dehydrogenase (short-subunit alcohol dehydrogenase family)